MNSVRERESRPVAGAAIEEAGGRPGVEYTDPGAILRLAARHDYGVLVVAERRDGVLTTRFYSNLPAAERLVHRTRERGLRADLHLVKVVPLPYAVADDPALVVGEAR